MVRHVNQSHSWKRGFGKGLQEERNLDSIHHKSREENMTKMKDRYKINVTQKNFKALTITIMEVDKKLSVKRENRQMGQKNNNKYVEMVFNTYKQESIVKMEHICNKV